MRDAVVRPPRWCLTTKSAALPLPCTCPRLRRHQLCDFREAVLIPSLPSLQVQHPPRCTSGGVSCCSYKCGPPLSFASVTTVCPHGQHHCKSLPSVLLCKAHTMRLCRAGQDGVARQCYKCVLTKVVSCVLAPASLITLPPSSSLPYPSVHGPWLMGCCVCVLHAPPHISAATERAQRPRCADRDGESQSILSLP